MKHRFYFDRKYSSCWTVGQGLIMLGALTVVEEGLFFGEDVP